MYYAWSPGLGSRLGQLFSIFLFFLAIIVALELSFGCACRPNVGRFVLLWGCLLVALRFMLPTYQAFRKLDGKFSFRLDKRGLDIDSTDRLNIGWGEIESVTRFESAPYFTKSPTHTLVFDLTHLHLGPAVIVKGCSDERAGIWYALKVSKAEGFDMMRAYRPGYYYFRVDSKHYKEFERQVKRLKGVPIRLGRIFP